MSKSSTPKPLTEFTERCDTPAPRGMSAWLGIKRLSRIPDCGVPPRDICQQFCTDDERKTGVDLIKQYREQEAIADNHDADRRQRELSRLGATGGHGFPCAE